MFFSKSSLFLTGLLFGTDQLRIALAGGGSSDACTQIGQDSIQNDCNTVAQIDTIDQQELADNWLNTIYSENENGCWYYGKIVETTVGSGVYIIDTTNQENPPCNLVINTKLSHCVGTCPSGRRRRLSLSPEDKKYEQYAQQCGKLNYKVSLVIVDSHFYAVASPTAKVTGCPSFVTGATFEQEKTENDSNVPYKKDLKVLKDDDFLLHQDSLHIGTYQLSELQEAHEKVDPTAAKSKVYDIIKFNCADFMLDLASALDIKINAKITSFVTRSLLQDSGKDLANKIRTSINYLSLFGNKRLLRNSKETSKDIRSDKEVVNALIQKRVADYM